MIYIVVFIASAATMAFELAGARMIAPYLGMSVEVWAGVIGTVLGGLTLGYWLGGKMADKYPRLDFFAGIIFLSGVSVAGAWALRDIIPGVFVLLPLGSLTFTSFLIGMVLFVPASMFFGALSPYAAKLSLVSLDASARTVGKLSALGAFGSILGTVVTSSWIMPRIGISALLVSIAIILMVLSIIVVSHTLLKRRIIIGAILITVAYFINTTVADSMNLVADIDTSYGRVWVRETPRDPSGLSVRSVSLDPYATQCASFINADGTIRDELVFDYTKAFDLALALRPDAEALLVLGGCNYSYPRHILQQLPNAQVDVVEIDPGMTEIARTHFGLTDDPRMGIYHEDGRTYINRSDERYDIIFTDAFNSAASVPHHLATHEALEHIRRLLTDDGIVALNIIGSVTGPTSSFVNAELATIASVFPTVAVFQIQAEAHDAIQNLLIIASPSSEALSERAVASFAQAHAQAGDINLIEVPLDTFDTGMILTDDYAPVESLTHAVREAHLGFIRSH